MRESRGSRQLPRLKKWLGALVDLHTALPSPIMYDERNDFAFMCLCFWGKQLQHGAAILSSGIGRM